MLVAIPLILLAHGTIVHGAIFRMDYLPVGHVRTDPILNQTCLSDHVHTYYGAPLLYPAVSYQDLRNSNPALSSGNVEENLSLYWHPSVYQVEADGTRRLAEMGMTTAYYTWESGSGVRAFPNDFRMIGGLDPSVAQVEVSCVDSSPCQRGAACSSPSTFFPASACTELEVSMSFPRCWDGSQKTTLDQSHVIYVGPDEPCPSTHSVLLPQIDFFFRIFNYPGGYHEFSDGSDIFHADYISGWDENFLQNVLDNCGDMDETTVCSAAPFTFRNGLRYNGDGDQLQRDLQVNKVPLADTSCITNEAVTGIKILPRTTCSGTLLSANCQGSVSSPPPPPQLGTPSPVNGNATPRPTPAPTLEEEEEEEEIEDSEEEEEEEEIDDSEVEEEEEIDDSEEEAEEEEIEDSEEEEEEEEIDDSEVEEEEEEIEDSEEEAEEEEEEEDEEIEGFEEEEEEEQLEDTTEGSSDALPNCFSSYSTVTVQGKGTTPIADVQVGDHVLSSFDNGEAQYSRVYCWAHWDTESKTEYLQIHTTNSSHPLEVSALHMVLVGDVPTLAQHIQVGDALGMNQVVETIGHVQRRGRFAPLTDRGTVVVSGFVASTYVGLFDGVEASVQRNALHWMLTPLRVATKYGWVSCDANLHPDQGYSECVAWLLPMEKFIQKIPSILQSWMVWLALPFLALMALTEHFLDSMNGGLLVVTVAAWWWINSRNKFIH